MTAEYGYSNQKKKGPAQFKTIHSVGSGQFGTASIQKVLYLLTGPSAIVSVTPIKGKDGATKFLNINIVAHGARKADVMKMITGTLIAFEFEIVQVVDVNNFYIYPISDTLPLAAETADIMRWTTAQSDSSGSLLVTAVLTEAALVASYQEVIAQDALMPTVVVAPPGAKKLKIMTDFNNASTARIKVGGAVASTTSGMQLQAGRSEDFEFAGDVSVIMEAGIGNIFFQFGV